MIRTLYYGGSFDPIHFGHLRCSKAAAEAGGFGRVVLIPSWQSPLKTGTSGIGRTTVDRLAMCKLATNADPFYGVDDLEVMRTGTSYTFDTIAAIKNRGESEVNWLIGADQLTSFPRWCRATELVKAAHFVVMHRPGHPIAWEELPDWMRPLRRNVVDIPLVDASSTEVRRRVRAGEPIDDLVPPAVAGCIRDKHLYRGP
jgi:nicotinate-nucleotide adenylyltransferase